MTKYVGTCGCAQVEFSLNSDLKNVVNCHCKMCRKHNGASFSTYAVFPFKALEIVKGEENIGEYKPGTANKRFCKICGTPLFNTNEKYPGACMVYLGALNADNNILPGVNVWCDSKVSWIDKVMDYPCMAEGIQNKPK